MLKTFMYTFFLAIYSIPKCNARCDNHVRVYPDAVNTAHTGYIGGYENFIFAVPDKNISGDEAKSHRLDPYRKHQKLKDLKKGQNKKSNINRG